MKGLGLRPPSFSSSGITDNVLQLTVLLAVWFLNFLSVGINN